MAREPRRPHSWSHVLRRFSPPELAAHIPTQNVESVSCSMAVGLAIWRGQPLEIIENLLRVQTIVPCRKDRRVDDCVLRSVETQKISEPAAIHYVRNNRCPLFAVVQRINAKRIPSARIAQYYAA